MGYTDVQLHAESDRKAGPATWSPGAWFEGETPPKPRHTTDGLQLNKGYKLYTGGIPDGELWWAPHVKHFQQESLVTGFVAEVNAKAHGKVKPIDNAISYTSISINAPQYLLYLQARALRFGIVVIKSQLPSDKGFDHALTAAEALAHSKGRAPAALFVNATGLGAYKLCNDHTMFPIRGQTVLVKGEAIAERTRSGNEYASYCIPRPGSGSTILGGTRQKGEWNETPDQQTTQDILERAIWMVPELLTGPDGGFEVISVQCGLRPGRTDGPRMEKEIVANKKVVHAYGHAGAGYQNSIGSARLVVRLVQQSLVEKASAKL